MSITMTEMQKSALQEVGNIGAGHAAVALSQLMGKKIMIVIPSVEIFSLDQLNYAVDSDDANFILASLSILGDVAGLMIFALQEDIAMRLCDLVMAQPLGTTKLLSDLEQSAIKEIASILSGSYLNAVGELTGLSLLVSIPQCNIGGLSLVNEILAKKDITSENSKDVLCIKTEFIEAAAKVEGYLILIPANDAIKKIMSSLGV